MAANLHHRVLSPISCTHCQRLVRWPRYRRITRGEYRPLCWPCYAMSTFVVTLARQEAPCASC